MSDASRHSTPRRLRAWLAAALILCAAAAAQERDYLNPLTDAERELAVRIARDDARVREMAGDGLVRLVYVELSTVKSTRPNRRGESQAAGRFAEVLQYRYDGDTGVLALVDLGKRKVDAVERVEGGAVPLTQEDLKEAVRLALDDADTRALLGHEASRYVVPDPAATESPPYAIRALLVHAYDERDSCFRRRCVQLFFQQRDAYLIDSAVVDLTGRQVRILKGERHDPPSH